MPRPAAARRDLAFTAPQMSLGTATTIEGAQPIKPQGSAVRTGRHRRGVATHEHPSANTGPRSGTYALSTEMTEPLARSAPRRQAGTKEQSRRTTLTPAMI
jgi:hypothetical protein